MLSRAIDFADLVVDHRVQLVVGDELLGIGLYQSFRNDDLIQLVDRGMIQLKPGLAKRQYFLGRSMRPLRVGRTISLPENKMTRALDTITIQKWKGSCIDSSFLIISIFFLKNRNAFLNNFE